MSLREPASRIALGLTMKKFHKLQTERLILDRWQAPDWTALRPIATDSEVMRYITGGAAVRNCASRFMFCAVAANRNCSETFQRRRRRTLLNRIRSLSSSNRASIL